MKELSAERLIAAIGGNAHLALASEGGWDLQQWGIRHETKLARHRARVYRQTYPVPHGTFALNKNPDAFRTISSCTYPDRRIIYAWRNWDVIRGIPCADFVLILLNGADKVNGAFIIAQLAALERMLSIKRVVHAHLDHLGSVDTLGASDLHNGEPVFIQTVEGHTACGKSADI
jgi:hypothetical protein